MAFDEVLADRIRKALSRRKNIEEKTLFGCACFLLNGSHGSNKCCENLPAWGKANGITRLNVLKPSPRRNCWRCCGAAAKPSWPN
jgi:hypothetical protein